MTNYTVHYVSPQQTIHYIGTYVYYNIYMIGQKTAFGGEE